MRTLNCILILTLLTFLLGSCAIYHDTDKGYHKGWFKRETYHGPRHERPREPITDYHKSPPKHSKNKGGKHHEGNPNKNNYQSYYIDN